jgi:HK97 family phage portal protein
VGLLERFFKNYGPTDNAGFKIQLVTERGNGFYAWNGKLYKSDIIRACIRPKVRAMGKLIAKHIRDSTDGIKINPEAYMRMLLEEPNPYMTGQMMQEKLTTQLMLNNNAFALIIRDDFGYPVQIYPIPCQAAEVIYSDSGDIKLKFTMPNGKTPTFAYSDIVHLRRDFYNNDIFGELPIDVLEPVMEIVSTTDQGIVKAIQNSNIIKWLLKFKSTTRPEDIKAQVKDFIDSYMSMDSGSGGAAGVDAKYDLEQVKPESYVPNALQMDRTIMRLMNFFNTNEAIIQSKWDENGWTAYYEAEIEPDAMQLSGEFTRKLFTRKERGFGNKIIFVASNLQYASMATKLQLMQMVDRGAMTPNEWREILNMGPVEGGDKPIRRLDTAVVSETKGGE